MIAVFDTVDINVTLYLLISHLAYIVVSSVTSTSNVNGIVLDAFANQPINVYPSTSLGDAGRVIFAPFAIEYVDILGSNSLTLVMMYSTWPFLTYLA